MNPQSVNFKLSDYLSKGFELLKKDFGGVLTGFLVCFVMGIIPFCGYLGMGNFYKYLRKKSKGLPASPGEIFNFDDFMPYFILQLIVLGGVIVLYLPLALMMPAAAYISADNGGGGGLPLLFFPYMLVFYVVLFYFVLKGFYIPALISLKGIKDIKTAWNISTVMTKNNLLNIFLFSLVASILGSLGAILCGIGIILTLPFTYAANYFAYEDALQQIDKDEIAEIGTQGTF